jgi:hypothetical protein
MIRKPIFIFFASLIFAHHIYGQDSLAYKSKWQTRFLYSTNFPITKLYRGSVTDYLLQYDDKLNYWQIISVSYFFRKHWGMEFNVQMGTSGRIGQGANKFTASMQSEYSDKYYVSPEAYFNTSGDGSPFGEITRGYLGIIYRWETNRFYLYPKFSIGLTSFNTGWGYVNLKEKNSNNEYIVSYAVGSDGITPHDNFTIAPSVSFGYMITKHLYLNADIMFSYYRTNFAFKKEFTNLYTQESTVDYFDYKKNVFSLSLGAGVIWAIGLHRQPGAKVKKQKIHR